MHYAVAFLLDSKDVLPFVAKQDVSFPTIVYASGRETKRLLDEHKIRYKTFNHFLPMNTTADYYAIVNKLSMVIDQRIFASVRIYFLELLRSTTLIQEYLNPHPPLVYISDVLNEPIYLKYHSQNFNLFNRAMLECCKFYKIKTTILRRNIPQASIIGNLSSLMLPLIKNALGPELEIRHSGTRKTMVISASSYHLSNLKEFVRLAGNKWNIIVLGKISQPLSDARSKGYTVINTSNFPGSYKDLVIFGQQLAQALVSLLESDNLARKLLFSLKLPLLYARMVESQVRYWKLILIPESAVLENFFSRMLKSCKPSIVVSSNSIDNFSRTLHLVSAKHGVKRVVILHYPLLCKMDAIEELSGIQSVLFLNGLKAKNLLDRYPINFSLKVTGIPLYDKYRSFPTQKTKFHPHKRISILFLLSQNPLYLQNSQEEALFEALSALNHITTLYRITVTIRTHPDQPIPLINKRRYNFPVRVRNNYTLEKELQLHQIVISQTTSAAVDAIICRKPLIYLNTQSVKDYSPFARDGAAIGVSHVKNLTPAILSLIKDPCQLYQAQRQFIKQYCYKLDGRASERILSLINKIVTP